MIKKIWIFGVILCTVLCERQMVVDALSIGEIDNISNDKVIVQEINDSPNSISEVSNSNEVSIKEKNRDKWNKHSFV